jgi:hypothetical protein
MAGGLKYLIQLTDKITDEKIQMKCCWTIGDLCKRFPVLLHSDVHLAIYVLCRFIVAKKFTDTTFLINCFWGIFYNSNNRANIHTIINSGAVL